MATPFVAGTAALMFQANPNLTPNLVKARFSASTTAQTPLSGRYNALRQGAGFMDVWSPETVQLAKFYAHNPDRAARCQSIPSWSKEEIIWGRRT